MTTKNIFVYTSIFFIGITVGRMSYSKNVTPFLELSTGSSQNEVKMTPEVRKVSSSQTERRKSSHNKTKSRTESQNNGKVVSSNSKYSSSETNFKEATSPRNQQSVENYIRAKFENFSDQEVVEFLQNYTHIDTDDIPNGISAADFAARLGEIFANGVEISSMGNGAAPAVIEFDVTTNAEFQAIVPKDEFIPENKKIYASFNTELYDKSKVMVKWYRIDTPKVYIFDTYEIDPEKDNNYIWLNKDAGWNEGVYGVEIYSMESNLDLMAYGEYAVEQDN